MLFILKKIYIYPAYGSKHDSNQQVKNKFSFNDFKQWHYLAVKKLSRLLRRITFKHHGDFYCLYCHHYFATENKRQLHKKVCENEDFCNIIMPSEDTKILVFNQYQKYDKVLFIIYGDLECIIEKIDGCKNNPESSSTSKISKHISLSFSMSTISRIDKNREEIQKLYLTYYNLLIAQ